MNAESSASPAQADLLYALIDPNYRTVYPGLGEWHSGFTWFPPSSVAPGNWMPPVHNVQIEHRGYHLLHRTALVGWSHEESAICEAEGRGQRDDDPSKAIVAFEEARLLKVIGLISHRSVAYATCEIVSNLLPIFHTHRPKDNRPSEAVKFAMADAAEIESLDDRDSIRRAAKQAADDVLHFARGETLGSANYYRAQAAAHVAWAAWAIPTLHAVIREVGKARQNVLRADYVEAAPAHQQTFLARLNEEMMQATSDCLNVFLRCAEAELARRSA